MLRWSVSKFPTLQETYYQKQGSPPYVRQLPRLTPCLTKACLGRMASFTEAGTFREGPTPFSLLPSACWEDLMAPSHHDPKKQPLRQTLLKK